MFKKPGSETNRLADRIRHATERKSRPDCDLPLPKKSHERAPRDPQFKQGLLILDSGQKLTVVIKNLSATGARVEMHQHLAIPDEVLLTETTLGLKRRARVIWRDEGAAGLRFI